VNNSPVCIDASLIVRLVLSGDHDAPAVKLWKRWRQAERSLVAPTLLYYEVSNALHRYVVHGDLLPEEGADALQAAFGLGIALYGNVRLHQRALEIARRYSLPAAYDAHYLALAEELGAEFWTADRRLVRALDKALPWVHQAGE